MSLALPLLYLSLVSNIKYSEFFFFFFQFLLWPTYTISPQTRNLAPVTLLPSKPFFPILPAIMLVEILMIIPLD